MQAKIIVLRIFVFATAISDEDDRLPNSGYASHPHHPCQLFCMVEERRRQKK